MGRSCVADVPGVVVAMAGSKAEGANGVSGSLRSRGELETVAASYPAISNTDADQYATGDGSCVDASVMGCSVPGPLPKSPGATRPTACSAATRAR